MFTGSRSLAAWLLSRESAAAAGAIADLLRGRGRVQDAAAAGEMAARVAAKEFGIWKAFSVFTTVLKLV